MHACVVDTKSTRSTLIVSMNSIRLDGVAGALRSSQPEPHEKKMVG